MKQYPRIYSISTVGLVHHQEFDYLFHPFRTDFIGESGSGKSMIADLVQLILVGSDVFVCATDSTRKPEGMVLHTEKRGKGLGYAFMNIEMIPGQYLVVGSYIETGNSHTQAFIVQAGYDWQNIQYLSAPLSFQDFLREEEILPVDLLLEWLGEKGIHSKFWQRYKEFHRILYREKIVPLDLAANERLLNDYAGILQSFSRAKTLDTKSSDSLKQFLFGNQDAKKILESYRNAEKDLESVVGEYGSNLKEIERVTQKQKALLELKGLKDQKDEQQNTWLYKNLLYRTQEAKKLEKEVKTLVFKYIKAKQHHIILKEFLKEKIDTIEPSLPRLEKLLSEANERYDEISPRNGQVKQVLEWLTEFNCSYEKLSDQFKLYKKNQAAKGVLKSFLDELKKKNVETLFENIPEKQTLTSLNRYIADTILTTNNELLHKKRLKKFANIKDPESLAYWALSKKKAFNKEEESAILHFQNLGRKKPSDFEDYLPKPEELILSLSISEKEEKGFWLNLNGVRKYIEYVEEQILNTTDENKIRSYFEQYTTNIEKDIYELEQKCLAYSALQEIVSASDAQALAAYHEKETLLMQLTIPSLDISEERFGEYHEIYLKRNLIQEEFLQARTQKNAAFSEFQTATETLKSFQAISRIINVQDNPTNEVQIITSRYLSEYVQEKNNEILSQQISNNFDNAENKVECLNTHWETIKNDLTGVLQLSKLNVDEAIAELEKAKEDYLKVNTTLPEILALEESMAEPRGDYEKYFESEATYNSRYDSIIDIYIPSEAYKLKEIKDFEQLSKNLLPEAFYGAVVEQSDTSIIEAVANYLTRINEKNRQLNTRKIQKIKNLLDEVDEMVTHQENTIRRIDNFLKSGAQITGGYTARLRKNPATNYPKTWMSTFKERIEDEQQSNSLENKLGEKIDLAEMMKAAFLSCGGQLSANPSPAKLLNPSSYYELSFAMESEIGRINKGSTGQIYASVALLCIARLSIISSEEGKNMPPAVRIMPIDEAEGLGSNYDMLYDIAQKYDYQLISMSIGPVGKFKDGEQYLYMLHKNMEVEVPVNYTPIAILSEADRTPNITEL
ncbi:MAG TPA: hypothetical protein VF868_11780 [Bacteroidia bacterium]|jgi:hypothetical protein